MRGLVGKTELSGDDILVHDNGGRLVGHRGGVETARSIDSPMSQATSLETAGDSSVVNDRRCESTQLDVTFGEYYVPAAVDLN